MMHLLKLHYHMMPQQTICSCYKYFHSMTDFLRLQICTKKPTLLRYETESVIKIYVLLVLFQFFGNQVVDRKFTTSTYHQGNR